MKTLFKNAKILKMDDSPIFEGDLLVEGNRIKLIGEDISEEGADKVIDCEGNLLMPGLKNAHAHGAMTFLKNKADSLSLDEWLFNIVFPREAKLRPSDVYHCFKVAVLEYIKNGVTTSFEQYYYPLETARAAEELGFRVVLLGTYNSSTSKSDLINLYKSYNSKKDSLVTYNIGIHAEYTTTQEEVNLISSVIHELKAPFSTHISETKKEVDECYEKRGISPVQYFANNGCFDFGGSGFHCIYFDENDMKIFKEKNISIVTNPGSNLKLSSGICPIEKYAKYGLNIAIGTDGPASNDSLNIFNEIYLASKLVKKLDKNSNYFSSYDYLKIATVNGAKAMNLSDCDTLEIGKKADIIMVDLKKAKKDILDYIVYSGNTNNVKLTMIDGIIKYFNGSYFINEDIDSMLKSVQDISERIDKEINQ